MAGLVRAGLGYLPTSWPPSTWHGRQLLPYAKPITVKPGSFAVLPDMDPDRDGAPGAGAWAGEEWQVAVGEDTGRAGSGAACAPGFVIVPRYDAGAATCLTPLSDTEAFFSLALNAVNLLPHGSAGQRALGRLAAQCELLLADLLGPRRGVRAGVWTWWGRRRRRSRRMSGRCGRAS